MNENYRYFNYLFDLGEDGYELYDRVEQVVEIYNSGVYYSVPNAVRMFYELLICLFLNKTEDQLEKGKNGLPSPIHTLDSYFKNRKFIPEYKTFYMPLRDEWDEINTYSHYLGINLCDKEKMKEVSRRLISSVCTMCEVFYKYKTNKIVYDVYTIETIISDIPYKIKLDQLKKSYEKLIETQKEFPTQEVKNNSEIQSEIQSLKVQIDILKKNTRAYQLSLSDKKQLIESLSCQNTDLESQIQELDDVNNKLVKDNEELKKQILSIKPKEIVKVVKSDTTDLENEIENLKINNESLQLTNKTLTDKINRLETRLSNMRKSFEAIETNEYIQEPVKQQENENKEPEDISAKVLEVIAFMNKLKAFATIRTITNIFIGNTETQQMRFFPQLKECKYFGTCKDINILLLDKTINKLIEDGKVKKSSGCYNIV